LESEGGEIGDLAASFNTLMTALAERSQETEAFLADVAHEFKNPIATIRAAAEQLESPTTPQARRAQLAEMILRSSASLDALVSQFLDLARAEAGLPKEVREPVNLSALLSGLVGTFRLDVRYAGVTFRVEASPPPCVISGVSTRMESAFRNLLDNAASFAGVGGTVDVRLDASNGCAEVIITDNGPGIPAELLPRLFERFLTTRGDRRGTGLGLALTRAVIEAHGGAIVARSPEGQGAQFVVRLPFTDVSHPVR
jgi:two-component system sensor histidine kinase ChvG